VKCTFWFLTVAGLAAAVFLAGCGKTSAPPAVVEMPLPVVDLVPLPDRVAYAIERLERGPRPTGALVVPTLHRRNLELAEDDLIALEREAQRQLAEPALIRRITGMVRRNADPWHNVLGVLLGMQSRPADLVLAWTEPVLQAPADLTTLRLAAVRVLVTISDPRAGDILLALLRNSPGLRELAPLSFSALLRQGGAARRAALDIVLRDGGPELWGDAWSRIAGLVPPGEVDRDVADVLTWWSALIAGSGPRLSIALPHVKSYPWLQARLAVDPAAPRAVAEGPHGLVFGPLSLRSTYGSGWFPTDLAQQAILPQYAFVLTGKLPAAEGRCPLAHWGFEPYVAAVVADLDREVDDEGLYYAAKHCMLGRALPSDGDVKRQLTLELDQAGGWDGPRVRQVQRLLASLGSCDDADAWRLFERVLFDMQPLDICRPAIEQAYDAMRARPQDLQQLVVSRLEGTDAVRAGIAMHLVRRARDPVYLDALERLLDHDTDPGQVGALRRTLAFIYSRGYGVEPARFAAFVKRYEGWLEEMDDREFVTLATGLLDFEEAGERAFAQGLRGPKRALFLAAWPRGRRIVSAAVAEAAIAPMGVDTPRAVVGGMLARAYYSFPAESAAQLVALRRRLLPGVRDLVAPVLERVRHRAPFRRRVK